MTCHRVPTTPSLCTCGVVLDITQWHGDDDIGNDLCPTCSGCGCEPNERNLMNEQELARLNGPKMLRETLCVAQGEVMRNVSEMNRRSEHALRLQRLIEICDEHRPLGPDGKHGTDRCTSTCGCDDTQLPVPEPDHSMCARLAPNGEYLDGEPKYLVTAPNGMPLTSLGADQARLAGFTVPAEPTVVERAAAEIQRADERGDDSYKAMARALDAAGLLVRDGEQ